MTRPIHAYIDLQAIRNNYQYLQGLSPTAHTLAVLKANAYGHGSLEVAQALADLAPAFALASLEEAQLLRQSGILRPLLLLEGFFSDDELAIIEQEGHWCMIHSWWQVHALEAYMRQRARHLPPAHWTCWIKIDTGMHRLGFAPNEAETVIHRLRALGRMSLCLASHCARADELTHPLTKQQINSMQRLQQKTGLPMSLANSAATLAWPGAGFDWQRPGLALYGLSPFAAPHPQAEPLQVAMTLHSQVLAIQRYDAGSELGYGGLGQLPAGGRVAVIAGGYGDGYPRQAEQGAPVYLAGQCCRLIGRVSMDMLMVDVSHLPQLQVGAPVELWGRHLTAQEVARHCNTLNYTLVTGLLARVPRVYSPISL